MFEESIRKKESTYTVSNDNKNFSTKLSPVIEQEESNF